MLHTQTITVDEVEMILVIAEPHSPVRVRYLLEAVVEEGRTGIENTTPIMAAMRIGMAYDMMLFSGDTWQQWRDVLAQINGRLVAMPLWPDVMPKADWDEGERIHKPQLVVCWDDGFTNVEVADAGSEELPDTAWIAPLLIGRLKRTPATPIDVDLATTQLVLEPDRKWEWRIEADEDYPGDFNFQPDWVGEVQESTRDGLDLHEIGMGALRAQEGWSETKYRQRMRFLLMDHAEIRRFLGFWQGVGGNARAFDWSSPWKPGNETDFAPHDFDGDGKGKMRFASPILEITYDHPVGIARVALEHLFDTDVEQAHPGTALLYRFFRQVDSIEERVTDWEAPIEYDEETWRPARIDYEDIETSMELQRQVARINCWQDDVALMQAVVKHEVETPLWVEITELNLETEEGKIIFVGKLQSSKPVGKQVKMEFSFLGGVLERELPTVDGTRTCVHQLFNEFCGLNKSTYQASGKLIEQWSLNNKVLLDNLTLPTPFNTWKATKDPTGYFAFGWAEAGSGANKQWRFIVQSHYVTADVEEPQMHLDLLRPFRGLEPGDTVTFWPGCDGTIATCHAKFNNRINHLGFPFAPDFVKEQAAVTPKAGK